MGKNCFRYLLLLTGALLWQLLPCGSCYAQKSTTKDTIIILDNDYAELIQKDGARVHKLVNNVKVRHGSDTLYCDSAFFYVDKNSIEAFGDARIFQADGTMTFADYMRYTGWNKIAYLRGNASVSSGEDNLWSDELEYDLNTKTGKYRNGGTLQTNTTTVTSNDGEYNTHTKDARFKHNVVVDDTAYHATSEDLGYNTETKIVTFFAPSEVINDKSILHTSSGTYDSKNRIAHFDKRPNIINEAQYIESDTLDYDRNTGWANAYGNVIAIDTTPDQRRTLYSEYGQYNEQTEVFLATILPIAKISSGKDSMFIRSDTFFSAPEAYLHRNDTLSAQDSLQKTLNDLQQAAAEGKLADSSMLNDMDTLSADAMADSDALAENENIGSDTVANDLSDTIHITTADSLKAPSNFVQNNDTIQVASDTVRRSFQAPAAKSSKPRYFMAYHHVLIYSDSAQGRCDSLIYTQTDSLMRMFYNPVLWSGQRQILGDTIIATLDSSHIRKVYVPRNGILVSRSGPEKAGMFDQVQGNKMWAYFLNNKTDSVVAMPNAATIYYATDDENAYVGVSEVKAEKLLVLFDTASAADTAQSNQQKIKQIKYYKSVDSKMTPMKDVEPADFRLSRFKWIEDKRPKSLGDFMNEKYELPASDTLKADKSNTTSAHNKTGKVGGPQTASPAEKINTTDTASDESVPPFEELLKKKKQEMDKKDSSQ